MHDEMIKFLGEERVGVLAVNLLDDSPHGAVMHYSHSNNPLQFLFQTDPKYKKCESLHKNGSSKATLVIGTSEDAMKTFQADGMVYLKSSDDLENDYYKKFPEKVGAFPENIFITFEPEWWRYTDWKTPEGKQILTSEE